MKNALIFIAATMIGIGAAAAGSDDKFDSGKPPGFKHGEKTGWGDDKTPPGWNNGEKEGWDEKNRPPGLQAKKNYDDKGEHEDKKKDKKD